MPFADACLQSTTCMTLWQQVPAGGMYIHLAWGPTGQLAAAFDNSIHFLNPLTGSIIDTVEAAHDAAISSMEWASALLAAGTVTWLRWLTHVWHQGCAVKLLQHSALVMHHNSCAPSRCGCVIPSWISDGTNTCNVLWQTEQLFEPGCSKLNGYSSDSPSHKAEWI